MKKWCLIGFFIVVIQSLFAQMPDTGRKSYSSFGPMELEDNSFLMEEAFNQGMGVIQNISTLTFDAADPVLKYSFTQEIPITDKGHQFSYSLYYTIKANERGSRSGFGDLVLSYRPLLLDEDNWMMMIPRFSFLIPTGDAAASLGTGGLGLQFNLAITKRLSKSIVTHYNVGVTRYLSYNHYSLVNEQKTLTSQRNITNKNAGASVVWHATAMLNVMLEFVSSFDKSINDDGKIKPDNLHLLNPGIRYAFEVNNMQVVPGIAAPLDFKRGNIPHAQLMFYLSFEPSYK